MNTREKISAKMSFRFKSLGHEEGLTLIEIMVSMMIFLIVSAGVAGTLMTGLRSTVSARQGTFGKEVAQQRIEEMRSRAFYVQYSADPEVGSTADIDLLDSYYSNVNSSPTTDDRGWSGIFYSGSDAHYTTTSPPDIRGIVTTVETRFVDSNREVIVPPGTYDSNSADDDVPASYLVTVKITTSWSDRSEQNSYVLDSLISGIGQSVTSGTSDTGGSGGEEGCVHVSNSRVNARGVLLTASTGTGTPYTDLVTGTLGDAYATAAYNCSTTTSQTNATGGTMTIVGGTTYTGAIMNITGPPDLHKVVGPLNVSAPATYPKPSMTSSKVIGNIEDGEGTDEVEVKGEAMVGTQSLQLAQVEASPTDTISGYKRWDFTNPIMTVTGAGSGSDGEDVKAEIEQEDGVTSGKIYIAYQQINIVPLQKWPIDATTNPSAAQGLAFIRNFQASSEAKADGTAGHATTAVTYSFTLGMFNPNKSGCTYSSTGDTCYDFYAISPSNPLQNVSLGATNYGLQQALMTEWYSATTADISYAMTVSSDGTTAAISVDALVKISTIFATEARWKKANNKITLETLQGLQKLWIGAMDTSVVQNG